VAQIFRPSVNSISRMILLGLGLLPWVIIYVGSTMSRSPYNTKVGVEIGQPVPFSHIHHANELGIDCRFCHTTVETSSYASYPPTQVCMSCHSQIWTNSPLLEPIRKSYATNTPMKWNIVNHVPDFVYFNHSIHVNRGVSCNQCHGPVQNMPITYKGETLFMTWCLGCHREPERFLYKDKEAAAKGLTPRQQVFNLYLKYQSGAPLTPKERSLLEGVGYDPTEKEIEEGNALVKELKINKAHLDDCTICHH